MKKILMACAACAVMVTAAPAQQLPTLSQFLSGCYRDTTACRLKLKDYVTAAQTQKNICIPDGTSINEAVSETLRWLRADNTHAPAMDDGPFDDGLFTATTTLYPCKEEAPPPPPPPPAADPSATPPADQPAAPPQ
jgi:hypothetical protein